MHKNSCMTKPLITSPKSFVLNALHLPKYLVFCDGLNSAVTKPDDFNMSGKSFSWLTQMRSCRNCKNDLRFLGEASFIWVENDKQCNTCNITAVEGLGKFKTYFLIIVDLIR